MTHEHPARHHRYITTASGQRIACPNIRTSQIYLQDIAHSLALQARYLGHTTRFYSVAEHSALVALIARTRGESLLVQKCALLHDAHEAYIGDFPSPFKVVVPELRDFERSVEIVVRERFELPGFGDPLWARVKQYDLQALHYEAYSLFASLPDWVDQTVLDEIPASVFSSYRDLGQTWQSAKREFEMWALDLKLNPNDANYAKPHIEPS